MMVTPSPGKVMSAASTNGSLAGTDRGLRATAGEGEGEAAAAVDGDAAGDGEAAAAGDPAGLAAGLAASVGFGAAVGLAVPLGPQPMAVRSVAVLATPPMMY